MHRACMHIPLYHTATTCIVHVNVLHGPNIGLSTPIPMQAHAAVDKIFTEKLDLPELAFEARRLGKKVD